MTSYKGGHLVHITYLVSFLFQAPSFDVMNPFRSKHLLDSTSHDTCLVKRTKLPREELKITQWNIQCIKSHSEFKHARYATNALQGKDLSCQSNFKKFYNKTQRYVPVKVEVQLSFDLLCPNNRSGYLHKNKHEIVKSRVTLRRIYIFNMSLICL